MTEIDHEKAKEHCQKYLTEMQDGLGISQEGANIMARAYLDMVKLHKEEARLNGMGSERELKLMAERDEARQERDGLLAARIAYASEFDGDVGSIHKYIRQLKATCEKYRAALVAARDYLMSANDYESGELLAEVQCALADEIDMRKAREALASNAGEWKEE